MKINTIIFFSLLFILQSCSNNKVNEIDKLVKYCAENGMFNGTIIVAEKGEILYEKSIGKADFEDNIPVSNETLFPIASITKQFTAMGIMILVEREKLDYSDTLGSLLPELPNYYHSITVKELLQHTSGLTRGYAGDSNKDAYQKLVKDTAGNLLHQSGSKLQYSNRAYLILAQMIEKISGMTYEEFLTENIFQPLGMSNTFVMDEESDLKKERAKGYDGFGKKWAYDTFTYGSTGIYSTAEDLLLWCQSFTTDQIIPYASKNEAYKPAVSNSGEILNNGSKENNRSFGFGLFMYTNKLEGVVGHGGIFGGFHNVMFKDLKNDRDIIVLTNNGRYLPTFDFGNSINHILRGEIYEYPKIPIDLELRRKYYSDINRAITEYKSIKKNNSNKYNLNIEWHLNRLGYALVEDARIEDAIKIFKLLVSEFPESPNAYDSLGEVYHESNQYKLSSENYQKALKLDGSYFNAKGAKKMIKINKEKLAAIQ